MSFKEKVKGHITDDRQWRITKKNIMTVGMIAVMATAVLLILLHIETDQNARKTEISRRLEKKFLGRVSVGSSETQVFFSWPYLCCG